MVGSVQRFREVLWEDDKLDLAKELEAKAREKVRGAQPAVGSVQG